MCAYRILFVFDALVALILAFFFLDGLQYSMSGGAQLTWLLLLGVPLAGLALAWALHGRDHNRWAIAVLGLLALPPLAYVMFFALLLVANPNWQ